MSGKYQFEGPARLSSLIVRPATKNPAAPVRLRSNRGSSRSAMFAFATAIAEFISFFVARAGSRIGRAASIANWACNCAIKRRSVVLRPSCGTIAGQRHDRTRPGRWTLSMTSWRRDASFGCSRLSTLSPASRRRWHRGSPSAAHMSWRYWKESAMQWDSRRRSASIRHRVRVAKSCLLGLSTRRHAGLLPARQTRRQCLHRSVQLARFREECLNAHWFVSLADAQEKVERQSATSRSCCITTMTQPARHREKSAKLKLRVVRRSVSAQKP